ncbi:unnamed protein product [Candidula unifasciata]|uniref:G-protein coupled receptors family 1 profile domain-containing protein n=1 Tax=Candidula unifasciata TaxID=100452 RepID=A0A8S3ZCG9_9EUPU|nr:unnamed protein product [Candidula unifasciata]
MTSTDQVAPETAILAEFTKFEHVTVGVLYLLACVVGLTSNLLTAWTFYKESRLLSISKPWLHILLSLANIGVVAASPFPASSSFSGRWLYGQAMCQLYAFEGMFFGIAAIGAVIALCVERYYIANRLSSGSKDGSGWFYTWSLILVVGNALFWATMPLLGWSRYAIELTGTSCAIDWAHPDQSYISYMATLTIFSFVVPLLVALLCVRSAHVTPASQSVPGSSESSQGQGPSQVTEHSPGSFTETQLRMMCYIFVLLVLIGWGPFAFLCTTAMFGGSSGMSMLAASIPPLTCKLMVTMYPVVYAVVSPRFRHSFMSSLGLSDRKQD